VVESPQDSTRLKPDGYGLAMRCAGPEDLAGSWSSVAITSCCRDARRVLRDRRDRAAGEKLDADPADRTAVNVGTGPGSPLWWGKAQCLLMVRVRGGAFVVVGAGESPVHGEGRQRVCSARLECEELVVE